MVDGHSVKPGHPNRHTYGDTYLNLDFYIYVNTDFDGDTDIYVNLDFDLNPNHYPHIDFYVNPDFDPDSYADLDLRRCALWPLGFRLYQRPV